LHQCQNSPTTIFEDNQGAIELTENNKHDNRTKHIDIRHHFIRSHIDNDNDDSISHITTTDRQPADNMTKPLPTAVFLRRDALGMSNARTTTITVSVDKIPLIQ
jgi:hypothetical protein